MQTMRIDSEDLDVASAVKRGVASVCAADKVRTSSPYATQMQNIVSPEYCIQLL